MNRTRQAHVHVKKMRGRRKKSMIYNRYGDDFLIDKMKPEELRADLVSMGDLVTDKEWQIISDNVHFWQEYHSVTERDVPFRRIDTAEPSD